MAHMVRMVQMARCLNIEVIELNYLETQTPDLQEVERVLKDKTISHVACVHCETTTGKLLNPIQR